VLLKNDKNVLPISTSAKKIALIGPLGDAPGEMLGCWASRGRSQDAVSLATGIRAKLGPGATLTISPGCNITNSTAQISRAVSDTKAADVVILALGEPRDWSGESKSRTHLDVPGRQLELFQAIAATGKPAFYEPDVSAIITRLKPLVKERDVIVILSNGGFGGIHERLLKEL